MSLGVDVLVLGVISGLTYGIFALGLSLIYKSGRFINFAHGNLGALCAVLFGKLVVDFGVPYWISFLAIAVLGGALGALVELGIIRRLFDAPRLVLVVATLAVSQVFFYAALQRSLQADQGAIVKQGYPVPFEVEWTIGSLVLRGGHVAVLLLAPAVALGVAAFFRYTSYGQAVRASAENPDAARLAGISVRQMSTLVWVLAGVLAAVTMILLAPLGSVFQVGALGPSVMVRALAAALIGRMVNLPTAFLSGIGIGVIEGVVFANSSSGGMTDLVMFGLVMVALIWRGTELAKSTRDGQTGVTFGAETAPLPEWVRNLPRVRLLRRGSVVAAGVLALALPHVPILGLDTSGKTFLLTLAVAYAMVGLSMTLLVGWAGQVSLGQFALVGVGAFTAARVGEGLPLPVTFFVAGVVGSGVAILVGLPAVRIQGLFLAVSTLAFAVVANGWIFQEELFIGDPSFTSMPRPGYLNIDRDVYYVGLALLVFGVYVVRNVRNSSVGRAFISVRDNDKAARSDGVSATGTRLLSFALSGFLASTAGVVLALAKQNFTASDFAPTMSLNMLLMVIIGGLGSIPGAILGAIFLYGLPVVAGTSELVQALTSGIGVLVVLLFLPGGLMDLVHKVRDPVVAREVRRAEGKPPPPSILPPWRDLVAVARGRRPVEPDGPPPAEPHAPLPSGDGRPPATGDVGARRHEEVGV